MSGFAAKGSWSRRIAREQNFGRGGRPVTINADLDETLVKGIVMSASGNITLIPADGNSELTFTSVPAGWQPPYQVKKVTSASVTVYTVEY